MYSSIRFTWGFVCPCLRGVVQDGCLRCPERQDERFFPPGASSRCFHPPLCHPAPPCTAALRHAPLRCPPLRYVPPRPTPRVVCPGFGTVRFYLPNPKPGHTTGGSGRGARRGGGAGSGRTGCQQKCSPRGRASPVPLKASKTRRLNDPPEARTREIPFKPMEEQNPRLTTGLSAGREVGYGRCGGSRCLWREPLCRAAAEGASRRPPKNPSPFHSPPPPFPFPPIPPPSPILTRHHLSPPFFYPDVKQICV